MCKIVCVTSFFLSNLIVNRLTTLIFLLLSVLMMLFTVAGNHGLLHLQRMDQEVRSLQEKNEELSRESAEVARKIAEVKNDEHVLEQKGREELGLAKPNEIVYIFPEGKREILPDKAQRK